MQEPKGSIILATNSNNQAFAIGNGYGNLFRDDEQAQRRADKLEDRYKNLDFIVLDIKSSGKFVGNPDNPKKKDFEF